MAKKNKRKSPRGVEYTITARGLNILGDITGQGKLIKMVLKSMGKATARDLQRRIGKRLKTKKPGNVMASYLTKWRQKGLVVARVPKKKAA